MNVSTKPPLVAEQLLSALCGLLDPEFSVNVVDLGLIYDVQITDEMITIKMTLTSPGCPAGQVICDGVRSTLEPVAGERSISVNVVWEPVWTPEMISPAGREQLGWIDSEDASHA